MLLLPSSTMYDVHHPTPVRHPLTLSHIPSFSHKALLTFPHIMLASLLPGSYLQFLLRHLQPFLLFRTTRPTQVCPRNNS